MNALIRKEVRSILPLWLAAMLLATLPVWTLWPGPGGVLFENLSWLVFAPFGLGVLLLSLAPLGQELNWGTLPVLLSQPVARNRLWRVKVGVLAAALGCAFIAFCVSNHFRVDSMIETMKSTVWRNAFEHPGQPNSYFVKLIAETRRTASADTLLIGGLEVLAGFAGGLWTTLLCRQVTAAFWLTFVTPMGLALVAGKLLGNLPDSVAQAGLFIVLGAYSAAGFIWAKRMFLRAQDTQWTGGVVALPAWRTNTSRASDAGSRRRKPLMALFSKELQAQHINLLLAGGLLLLHLAVVVFRKWNVDYLAAHRSVEMSLEAVPVIWLVMPLLIGSVTVAEERKLGIFESSLCLPASRRRQFITKLMMVLLLGVILGGVVPLAIEYWAGLLRRPGTLTGLYFLGDNRTAWFVQLTGAVGLSWLAFYGSTLTRNTLQAMGAGLTAAVGACLIIAASQLAGTFPEIILWRGRLIGLIGWPVMLTTVITLGYRNYRWLQPGLRTWGRNILTLLVALLCVAGVTTTLYHRAWEAWLPEEPRHYFFPMRGLPREQVVNFNPEEATPFGAPGVKLTSSSYRTAVILPDERLWLKQQWVRMHRLSTKQQGEIVWFQAGRSYSGFVPGEKWRDVAVSLESCFTIRADGTLWDLSDVRHGAPIPKQVGSDRDWRMISGAWQHFCGLKSDGSLWQWGSFARNDAQAVSVSEQVTPERVGNETDWTAVSDSGLSCAAIKTDGTIWRWGRIQRPNQDVMNRYKWVFEPEPWLTSRCSEPVSVDYTGSCLGIVCDDGTLWIGGPLGDSSYRQFVEPGDAQRADQEMVRVGKASDWKQFRFMGWQGAVGIKRDGSLYEWNLHEGFQRWPGWVLSPTRPSHYQDWMSAARLDNAYLALARDGNLCLWGDRFRGNFYDPNGPDPDLLLMPSRLKARRIMDFSR